MAKYIHAFWHINGNSYQKLAKIQRYFGDFAYAWKNASITEFKRAGIEKDFAETVMRLRDKLDLNQSTEKLWLQDIFLVDWKCPEFPQELKDISQPPFLLYRKGAMLNSLTNRMAIVGMRKASMEGEKLAFGLGRTLGNLGVTIVSGLAFGIDAAAHSGSVNSSGKTIGILASGIANITPASHNYLAQRILANGGAIISEYPVTADAWKFQFIERNRLIAGLSHTVVIVEAAEKSGALITAKYALEQGKEILVFPGNPGRWQSQGCNNLIKKSEGQLIDSIGDVVQNLADRKLINVKTRTSAEHNLDEATQHLLQLIKKTPLSTDEIEMESTTKHEQIINSLSNLEIAGLISKNSELKWQCLAN